MSGYLLGVRVVLEGASPEGLCHGSGSRVNNLTYMDPSVLSRALKRNNTDRKQMPSYIRIAQFIGVCSSVKTCAIGENLHSVSDPISGPQERLIHAGALVPPPSFQC